MDSFDDIVSGLFEDTFLATEDQDEQDMYGVRVIFSDSLTEATHALVIPYVGYDPDMAVKMRDRVTKDPRGMTLLTMWYNVRYRHDVTPNRWIPTAARVVKLATIPF
jgi:hypothetical protein